MTDNKTFDVFLSHNSADKPVVEFLACRLEDEAGLKPFLDKWHLVPGNPWQEELETALDNSRACAVFIGPTGLGSWENEEMRSALDTRVRQPTFRVVPVVLPGASKPDPSRLPRFLSRLTWVDFRGPAGIRDTDAFHALVAGIAGTAPGRNDGSGRVPAVIECPYRGLKVFEEDHARFFFGRDATIQHLLELLRTTRILGVLGPSGSGKSSVVRAGLLPRLRAGALPLSDQWRYSVFKPGAHPIHELSLNLARAELTDRTAYALRLRASLESDERALHFEVRIQLANQPPDARCCLIVDQLEEVFTLCQERSERERFVDLLRYAATVAGGQTIVLLTMRTDFLSHAAEYRPLAEVLSAHQFLVSPMDEEDLREAIQEPARLVGLEWEDGLVETILQDVAHEPGMLPLLEDALLQLCENRTDKNLMTFSAYQATGGVRGALAQRADALFNTLSPDQQQATRRILLRLTQPGEGTADTRRRATLRELETEVEDSQVVKTVVRTFADARLLVTEEQQVDVAHEALIRGWPRLRHWIDDDRSALRLHRRITGTAEEWEHLNHDDGVLLRGAVLAQAREWRAHHEKELNRLEREFLDASQKLQIDEQEEESRRQAQAEQFMWLRWTFATALGVVVGVVSGAVVDVVVFGPWRGVFVELAMMADFVVGGVVGGAVLGISQWIVLRHQSRRAGWWVLATTLGVVAGAVAGVVVFAVANAIVGTLLGGVVGLFVGGAAGGAVLGLSQSRILQHHLNQASRWVLANTVGASMGVVVGLGVGALVGEIVSAGGIVGADRVVGGVVGGAAGGALLGAITGRVLILLLRRQEATSSPIDVR